MCAKYYWQGQRVRLRAVEPSDADTHFVWNQDSQMTRQLDYVWFPQSLEAVKSWAEKAAAQDGEDDTFHFAIETLAGELVGSLSTHECDPRNGTFMFGIAVREEHQRRGYASDAIRIVLRYYFEELRYQKATVHVYSFNDASIGLFERLGFRQEGRLRRMVYTQGQYFDEIVFGMTSEEFSGQPAC